MKHRRLRVAVVTGLLVALAGVTWIYFAPVGIGGGTGYVVTHGVSMEPRFHTGDLAIVRAASTYKVGQIVAYHSSLLHEVVLHRIVAIHHGRYVFKGDNNSFFDPVHPTKSELIGRLWIHVPRAGLFLEGLRTPLGLAIVGALVGLLMLSFVRADAKRDRSRIQGLTTPPDMRTMKPADSERPLGIGLRDGLIAAGLAALVFAALCVFAFGRPYRVAATRAVPYSQKAVFTYSADVHPDAVYPTGRLVTGDPIFLNFVDALKVGLRYRLLAPGAAHVSGTSTVALRLTGPTGWSRTFPLVRKRAFTNGHFTSTAVLNLTSVKNLLSQVQTLTGVSGSSSTVTVVATVHLAGHVSGSRVLTTFSPVLSFQMGATQLQSQGSSGNFTSPQDGGYIDTRHATVTVASSRANPLRVLGHSVGVKLLRILAAVGLVLSLLAVMILAVMRRRLGRLAEPEQIEAQYRHMIVPIADDAAFLGQEPVDLASMDALVRLAEHYGRLILHSHRNGGDSYLLDDGAVLYRYRVGKAAGRGISVPRVQVQGSPAATASHPALRNGVGPAVPLVAPASTEVRAARHVTPASPAEKASRLVAQSAGAEVNASSAAASAAGTAMEASPVAAPAPVPGPPSVLSVAEAAAAFAAAALAAAAPDAAPTPVSPNGAPAEPPAPVLADAVAADPPWMVFADGVAADPGAPVFADRVTAKRPPIFPQRVMTDPPVPTRAPHSPEVRPPAAQPTPAPAVAAAAAPAVAAAPRAPAPSVQGVTAVATRAAASTDVIAPVLEPSSVVQPQVIASPAAPETSPLVQPPLVPPEFGQGQVAAARLPQPPVVPPGRAWVPPAPPGFPPTPPPTSPPPASLGSVTPHAHVSNSSPLSRAQVPADRVDPGRPNGAPRDPGVADVGALAARVLMDSARRWRRRHLS